MVVYHNVSQTDVVNWWDSLNDPASSPPNRIFLRGWVSDDSGAYIESVVTVDPQTRYIIPLINSEAKTLQRVKSDINRKNGGVTPNRYIRINGVAGSSNDIHRVTFSHSSDLNRHFDGYWVSVSGLKKGDFIEFGGDGPRNFWTTAEYTMV